MPLRLEKSCFKALCRWERFVLAVWIVILIGICIRVAIWPTVHTVYPTYAQAARNWIAGEELYGKAGNYRYSPLVAISLIPFSLLPDRLGGILWRLLNAGVYLAALAWASKVVLPTPPTRTHLALVFLLVMPLSINSLNNGQSNPLVIGLLLAATAGVSTKRWNLASLCATLAALLKIYPIAIGLLLVSVYPRRLGTRFVLALLAGIIIPFFLQEAHYVLGQYASWLEHLSADSRENWPLEAGYRDLRLLLRAWLLTPNPTIYLAIQLLAGIGAAIFCLFGSVKGWPERRLLTSLLTLGCGWMTLLGPATESSTYILVAPSLAWSLLDGWLRPHPTWILSGFLCSYGLFLAASLAGWFPGVARIHALGLHPFGALMLMIFFLITEIRHSSRDNAGSQQT